MRAIVSTPSGLREVLECDGTPRWARSMQSGYLDASIPVKDVPDHIRGMLTRAKVEIHGATGCLYHGRVMELENGVLQCAGKWDDLNANRKGVVFRSRNSGWRDVLPYAFSGQSSLTVDSDGILTPPNVLEDGVWSFNNGWAHFLLPEPVSTLRLECDYLVSKEYFSGGISVYTFRDFFVPWSRYAVSNRTYRGAIDHSGEGGTAPVSGSFGLTINGTNITSIMLQFSGGQTILSNLCVYASPLLAAAASVPNVVGQICGEIGEANYECTVAGSVGDLVDDLAFGPKASAADKLEELLRYGDFRCYYTNRVIGGVDTPWLVFEPMSRTPIATLRHDGSSVIVDATTQTARGLASVVRAHYEDVEGRHRFVEATDTTPGHLLVDIGQNVVTDIDVDTKSAATALNAATALASRIGLDRATGTVVLKGSPNGLPANAYEPGFYEFVTPDGVTFGANASDITYDGNVATMTLDDTVSIEGLLARISGRGGSQSDRSW